MGSDGVLRHCEEHVKRKAEEHYEHNPRMAGTDEPRFSRLAHASRPRLLTEIWAMSSSDEPNGVLA